MHSTKLRKVGGSVMLAIPPTLLDILSVQSGDKVDILVERGQMVVKPQRRQRYTLDELLAQCHPKARRTKEDREWLSGTSSGDEWI